MSAESPKRGDDPGRRDDLRTLGLLPAATAEQILQAYLKLRRALRADSPALRAAASEDERRAMLRRVEEAYLRLAPQAGQPVNAGAEPPLDVRTRPSPFRARPSLPLR